MTKLNNFFNKATKKVAKTAQVTINKVYTPEPTSELEQDELDAIKHATEDFIATVNKAMKNTAKHTRDGMPTQADIDAMAESIMDDVIAEEQEQQGTGNVQADVFIHNTDEELNKVKLAFLNAFEALKRISGFNDLYNALITVIKESDGSWVNITTTCKALIDRKINDLRIIGREDKIAVLEFFKNANIFEIAFTGISVIANFAMKHLKQLGVTIAQNVIVDIAIKSIAVIAGVIKTGAKLVYNAVAWTASAFIATVLKLAFFVYSTIMSVVQREQTA